MVRFKERFGELPVFEVGKGVEFQFASGRDSTIAKFTLRKGTTTLPTSHFSEQFTYVVQGKMWYTVGNSRTLLMPGDAVLVPSRVKHRVEVLENAVLLDFFSPAWPELPKSVAATKKRQRNKKAR